MPPSTLLNSPLRSSASIASSLSDSSCSVSRRFATFLLASSLTSTSSFREIIAQEKSNFENSARQNTPTLEAEWGLGASLLVSCTTTPTTCSTSSTPCTLSRLQSGQYLHRSARLIGSDSIRACITLRAVSCASGLGLGTCTTVSSQGLYSLAFLLPLALGLSSYEDKLGLANISLSVGTKCRRDLDDPVPCFEVVFVLVPIPGISGGRPRGRFTGSAAACPEVVALCGLKNISTVDSALAEAAFFFFPLFPCTIAGAIDPGLVAPVLCPMSRSPPPSYQPTLFPCP
mmetsp:Transcript_7608/g.16670  ORF Transcript_7608/g.16670 Transcript_7608/m.16670 type:complete len:287 (-) Transcript_7608:56-916(-)